jgi:hypothetical protein
MKLQKSATSKMTRPIRRVKPNIRNRYSHLNGEAYAVNDSIRVNGCKLAAVQIPSFYNHHKYPGSPE